MTRLVPLAALCVLTLGLLGCRSHTPPAPAAPATPVATVKAGDLLKEYNGNVLAADAKYKGKLIQVSGKFSSVQKVPLTERYVLQLAPEDAGDLDVNQVQCVLDPSATGEAAKLQAGQTISVQGTCDGTPVPGQVKMSGCKLVK
jgi:hypothetical protein